MEKHIKLTGILNIVYSSFSIIGAAVLFAIAYGFGYLMEFSCRYNHNSMHDVPPEIVSIVPFILVSIGILLLLFAVTGIIGAIGILKQKEWGRIVTLVVSFFHLLSIPLGTILGVYSIWVLLSDETIRTFNPVPAPAGKKTTRKEG